MPDQRPTKEMTKSELIEYGDEVGDLPNTGI
jgi:hypothetical protein